MPLWIADERGLMRDGARVGAGCLALGARDGVVWTAGDKTGEILSSRGVVIATYAVPPGALRVCVGRRAYVLSSEADSVTAYDDALCPAFTAPAGDFPRDMCLSADGARLLVAGGASGAILLMDDSLRTLREYTLFGVVGAACFTRNGIAALCALPGEEMRTALVAVRESGVAETLMTLQGAPCALRALPCGDLLLGVTGEVVRVRGKRLLYRLPSPCPCRIRSAGRAALVVDACEGTIARLDRPPCDILYQGQPFDALIT